MDERILSGCMFIALSAIFAGHGVWSLLVAYRTSDRRAWTDRAIQGGIGMIAGGFFADLSARIMI
jgi:hypothetical protein